MNKINCPEHDALMLELRRQGVSRIEIGQRLGGRSLSSIKARLRSLDYFAKHGVWAHQVIAPKPAPRGSALSEAAMIEMIRRDGGFRVLPIQPSPKPVIYRIAA